MLAFNEIRHRRVQFPASLVGFDPGTAAEPRVVEGSPLRADQRDALLADRGFLRRYDLRVGDALQITQRLETCTFRIAGAVDEGELLLPAGAVYHARDMAVVALRRRG